MQQFRIELPELGLASETTVSPGREIALAPRLTRGDGETADIKSTIVLDGPDVAKMQPRQGEDANLADRRQNSDFWSVLLSLTLLPKDGETLTSAWVRVDLGAADVGEPPIVYSMIPGRQEASEDIQTTESAGANVKFFNVDGSRQTTRTVQHAEVLALYRLSSNPSWELTPSPSHNLNGPTDFVLIVKSPKGSSGSGAVSFGADVEWQEGLLRRHHEVSWAGEDVNFDLGGSPTGKDQG